MQLFFSLVRMLKTYSISVFTRVSLFSNFCEVHTEYFHEHTHTHTHLYTRIATAKAKNKKAYISKSIINLRAKQEVVDTVHVFSLSLSVPYMKKCMYLECVRKQQTRVSHCEYVSFPSLHLGTNVGCRWSFLNEIPIIRSWALASYTTCEINSAAFF